MSVPKSKVLSVSKGLMALADFKQACPQTTTSQTVYVNVHPKHQHDEAQAQSAQQQQTDVEDLSDVTVVKPDCGVKYGDDNPYAGLKTTVTRDLSTEEDIKYDYNQLLSLVKQKEGIAQALSIMLNLVEHNPLIVNKYIVAPTNILEQLIKLLTSADDVQINLALDGDVGCSCGAVKFYPVDKIYVIKNGETSILKYAYPEAIKLLDDHRISIKLVANDI